jgi:GntR family transcriptional regulator
LVTVQGTLAKTTETAMASKTAAILQEDLDLNSHEQLCYQLYNIIFCQILSGRFAIGDLIPPELELARQFNVSRATVRNAMEVLVNDGMVERKQGAGTVVISNHPASAPDWISSCLPRAFARSTASPRASPRMP